MLAERGGVWEAALFFFFCFSFLRALYSIGTWKPGNIREFAQEDLGGS